MKNLSNCRSEADSCHAEKIMYELDIDRVLCREDSRTTLMIKNIPNKYTSKMLLATIDEQRRGTYDFIYLPIDFKNKCNIGYAFINMVDPLRIVPFYKTFDGKKWEKFSSGKVASLAYAQIQGKAALVGHFQNSSLMNEDKRCRPILFWTDGPNAGDQLEGSEKKLEEAKTQLSRFRGQHNIMYSKKTKGDVVTNAKVEQRLASPTHVCSDSSQHSAMPSKNSQGDVKHEQRSSCNTFPQIREGSFRKKVSRPQIILPAVNTIPFQPVPTHTNSILEPIGEKPCKIYSELGAVETQAKGTKRKFEQKERNDLISLIGSSSSAQTVHCQTCFFISSQHKRRLRSLVLCPTNDRLFVTSALDGIVNFWQVQARGSSANFLSSSDCASVKQRRWPEDIAWHPHGNSLFSVYSADGGDSQVAVLDLNKAKERSHVNFLEDKPHVKGNINKIMFMPWEDTYFVTGGSDHAVVLWTEKDGDNEWKPKALHRNLHSSAVMGVAGLQHKQIVISAGADKRISGFDVLAGKADYRHQIESKCMSVIPNPFDLNLFMVQTGTPRRQLRLFDYRLRQTEIHAFGWEQESSQSQSALINQAWSPDGLYITSGSADPVIHIFDIRYNSQEPTQSIRAHQNRVFKAVWHHALPLLISISSDLNIGLHKIT